MWPEIIRTVLNPHSRTPMNDTVIDSTAATPPQTPKGRDANTNPMKTTNNSNVYSNSKAHTYGHSGEPKRPTSLSMLDLDSRRYVDRSRIFGTNCLPEKQLEPFSHVLCRSLTNKALLLLTAAAAASFILSSYQTLHQHDTHRHRARSINIPAIMIGVVIVVVARALIVYQNGRWFVKLRDKVSRSMLYTHGG